VLVLAALLAASTLSYLYARLQAIQPATIRHAEHVARDTGKAAAVLSRLIVTAADLLHAFRPVTDDYTADPIELERDSLD
jgi:hypothetical protein